MYDVRHRRSERCRERRRQSVEGTQEGREDPAGDRVGTCRLLTGRQTDAPVQAVTPTVTEYFGIISIRIVDKLHPGKRVRTVLMDMVRRVPWDNVVID